MFDPISRVSSQFDKGQIVTNPRLQQSGVIVAIFYNEFSGQFVYTVKVPGLPVNPLWCEGAVVASQSIDAVTVGDMVIADGSDGVRAMGPVVGKMADGQLIARFGGDEYVVAMLRVWRVWPSMPVSSFVRAAAQSAA